jgi:hypothetical protein
MKRRLVIAALILSVAAVVCVALYAAGCVAPTGGGGGGVKSFGGGGRNVLMTVNGRKVYGDEVLESMVVRNAIRQFASICTLKDECSKLGFKVDPEELKAKVEEQKAQMRSMGQDWNEWMTQQGISEKDVEDQLSMYMLFEQYVNSLVEVTPEQIQATWDKNKDTIITEYLKKNKLPDTEKPKVTFEMCKDLVTKQCKQENSAGKQMEVTDKLTQLTMLTLDAIKDPTERKLYEDLIINNTKKQIEEKQAKAAAPAAPAAGAPGEAPAAGAEAKPAPAAGAEAKPAPAPKEKGGASKDAPPAPSAGR